MSGRTTRSSSATRAGGGGPVRATMPFGMSNAANTHDHNRAASKGATVLEAKARVGSIRSAASAASVAGSTMDKYGAVRSTRSAVAGASSVRPGSATVAATTVSAAAAASSYPSSSTLARSGQTIIQDKTHDKEYLKGKFLGKGGFAKCYELIDLRSRHVWAGKVVDKKTLAKHKARAKLSTEIKIHRSLDHPNIVGFKTFFEDSDNVYLVLEMCANKSLMELMKRRERITDCEARYYLNQVLEATKYMHARNIIHRDLKLGNLFLNDKMIIKIGDFGLATTVETDGERKKTICGTPNYIAPEILAGGSHGHSFEVDVWSFGVILYTMLVGKPPFETSDVKATYRKIKANDYSYPSRVPVSKTAVDLIGRMLQGEPTRRPSLVDIERHPFFACGYLPASLPTSALVVAPNFPAAANATDKAAAAARAASTATSGSSKDVYFHREPFVRNGSGSNGTSNRREHERREDEAEAVGPARETRLTRSKSTTSSSRSSGTPSSAQHGGDRVSDGTSSSATASTLSSRVTRSSSASTASTTSGGKRRSGSGGGSSSSKGSSPADTAAENAAEAAMARMHLGDSAATAASKRRSGGRGSAASSDARQNTLHEMHRQLVENLDSENELAASATPAPALSPSKSRGQVWVSKWVDYSNKYGMGYQLTNNNVGVLFNDCTKMILAPHGDIEYLESRSADDDAAGVRRIYKTGEHPPHLEKKVKLLLYFQNYMREHLQQAGEESGVPFECRGHFTHVKKWLRTKHAIVFRLNNRVVQINFFDHTKLILCSDDRTVTFIDKNRDSNTYLLSDVHHPSRSSITSRLQYARDVIEHMSKIRTPTASPAPATNMR